MNYYTKLIVGFLIAAALVVAIGATSSKKAVVGSITDGYAYDATTTGANVVTGPTLKTVPGILGSVVITGTGVGTFVLYDATTSDATKRALATSSLRQLANFGPSTAAGTYTFDAAFTNGLVFAGSGVQASTTITFR